MINKIFLEDLIKYFEKEREKWVFIYNIKNEQKHDLSNNIFSIINILIPLIVLITTFSLSQISYHQNSFFNSINEVSEILLNIKNVNDLNQTIFFFNYSIGLIDNAKINTEAIGTISFILLILLTLGFVLIFILSIIKFKSDDSYEKKQFEIYKDKLIKYDFIITNLYLIKLKYENLLTKEIKESLSKIDLLTDSYVFNITLILNQFQKKEEKNE